MQSCFSKENMNNIAKKAKAIFPAELMRLVKLVAETAQQNSCEIFLVGGIVRDILLGVRNLDLDFVVEGDTSRLAGALVKKIGGEFIVHKKFGTATAIVPWRVRSKDARLEGVKIDFATARKEAYEKPAALPTVEFSDVKEDLRRRDFTINAMALAVTNEDFGRLIDLFNGQKDLLDKKVRVLHDASFMDDPTRILRAVRFEQRFGFRIEPHTRRLIKEAVEKKMLDSVSRQRIRNEIVLILKEKSPFKTLKRINDLCGLEFIHPRLRLSKKTEPSLDGAAKRRGPAADAWLERFVSLTDGLSFEEFKGLCHRFEFKREEKQRLLSLKKDGHRRFKEPS